MSANERTSVTITCPMVPVSLNVLRRKYRNPHAYARYRDGWQRTLWALIAGKNRQFLEAESKLGHKMAVDVTLIHSRLYDPDNAMASLKPILDSLVRRDVVGIQEHRMSEWQPARIVDAHGKNGKYDLVSVDAMRKLVVRVRPAPFRRNRFTCGATRLFYVHRDDVKILRVDNPYHTEHLVCEHEILTD